MSNSSSLVIEEQHNESKNVQNKAEPGMTLWEKLMSLGNIYLHILPHTKMMYYILSLVIFSMVMELNPPHLKILTGKHSVLNQVFVKLGWLWTSVIFSVYRIVSLSIHKNPLPHFGRLCVRFLATTFFFYIWCTEIFPRIENYTGACLHNRIKIEVSKRKCVQNDEFEYFSFDISGHSYLLTYCVLILMEESKESLYFIQLARYLRKAETPVIEGTQPLVDRNEAKLLESKFTLMAPLICLSYIFVLSLCFMWDFMLIITTIYYHTFVEKAIGSTLAFCMWYLLYRQVLPL